MSNLQSKVLSVSEWFFGVVFILGALVSLLEGSLLSGVLMLIAGSLFLPHVKRLILDKEPRLSRGKITAAGCIFLAISAFFIPLDDKIKDGDNKAEALTSDSAATETEL